MWIIDKHYKISMTKGDTPTIKFDLKTIDENDELVDYEFEEDDKVIFAVRKHPDDFQAIFRVFADLENKTVTLLESNTKNLDLGEYIWEMSLNKKNGYRCTFIANKILFLTTECA